MSYVTDSMTRIASWTATDLVERLGAIPLNRLRYDPAPGTATEEDVVRLHESEERLWYFYPKTCEVHAYTSPVRRQILSPDESVDGGDVLPGFSLPIASVFTNTDQ
jgi:hypothetical protein